MWEEEEWEEEEWEGDEGEWEGDEGETHLCLELGLRVESDLRRLVESLKVANRRRDGNIVWEHVLQMPNQHPELSAPISHVVDSGDIVPHKLQQPTDAFADDGGPQMAHVHLLGNVW